MGIPEKDPLLPGSLILGIVVDVPLQADDHPALLVMETLTLTMSINVGILKPTKESGYPGVIQRTPGKAPMVDYHQRSWATS